MATKQETTKEYVEGTLGLTWEAWSKMSTADRVEAVTGKRPAYLDAPAGPERLAAFHKALGR